MARKVLIFGNIESEWTEEISRAIDGYFDDTDLTLYLLGGESPDPIARDFPYVDSILYDPDIERDRPTNPDTDYLAAIEEQYGISSLWKCINVDRKLIKQGKQAIYHDDTSPYSRRELLVHLEARVRALEPVFSDNEFEFVMGQHISMLGGMLTYLFAEHTDTPFFRIGPARIGNQFNVYHGLYEESTDISAALEAASSDPDGFPTASVARDHVESVRGGRRPYSISSGNDKPPGWRQRIGQRVGRVIDHPRPHFTREYYYQTVPVKHWWGRLKKEIRRRLYLYRDIFDQFDPSEQYAYFPLQSQPENSLMVWAPFHTDLPGVIRNVVKTLPAEMVLYVNEHPRMFGARPVEFYRRLQRIPRVRVVPPAIDQTSFATVDIIENAKSVVAITSSVGEQAAICGVPSAALGRPGYAQIESVHTPAGYGDLQEFFDGSIKPPERGDVIAYLAAKLAVSIPRHHSEFPRLVCEVVDISLSMDPDEVWRETLRRLPDPACYEQ